MSAKLYRFDFDKGVPVIGSNGLPCSFRWRKGIKTIPAYGLQNAVKKFAMPVVRKFGIHAKLNVIKAWSSTDGGKTWNALDLASIEFAAYLTGCFEREKSTQQKAT